MAEIINFKSKSGWNSLQDLSNASPAKDFVVTKSAEAKINKFDVNERLRKIKSKLGSVAKNATESERLVA